MADVITGQADIGQFMIRHLFKLAGETAVQHGFGHGSRGTRESEQEEPILSVRTADREAVRLRAFMAMFLDCVCAVRLGGGAKPYLQYWFLKKRLIIPANVSNPYHQNY